MEMERKKHKIKKNNKKKRFFQNNLEDISHTSPPKISAFEKRLVMRAEETEKKRTWALSDLYC